MARSKKTVQVLEFTVEINQILRNSTCSPEQRSGFIGALEMILMKSGNYRGFRYLTDSEVPAGHLPGINISPIDGQHLESMESRFKDTDYTRVSYFC